jgi:hypothetical protein
MNVVAEAKTNAEAARRKGAWTLTWSTMTPARDVPAAMPTTSAEVFHANATVVVPGGATVLINRN